MKNNLFLLVLLCLTTALCGCVKELESTYANGRDDGKLQMTLAIGNMEEIATRSAASSAERSIKNLVVLIFDKTTGKYREGEIVAPGSLTGTDGDKQRTVTVSLSCASGDKVVVLANYDPSITKIPLKVDTSTTANINKMYRCTGTIDSKIAMPMSGEFSYPDSGTATCQLTRSFGKVQLNISSSLVVGSEVDGGFTMKHWQAYQVLNPLWSAIYSESAVSCTVKSGVTSASFVTPAISETRADGENWYLPEYPSATKAKEVTVSNAQFHKDRTCLIVTTTGNKFYRIDLYDHTAKKFIDVRRNTHITVTITKVNTTGYTTVEEALAAPGGNLEYKIKIDGENDQITLSNGSYALSISNNELVVYTDETEFALDVCTARYILAAELPALPDGVTSKFVFSNSINFEILTRKISNTDTPITVHVRRTSSGSTSTTLDLCLGSIVHKVSVTIRPTLKAGSSVSLGAGPYNYRWIKMADGVTLNEAERKVYVDLGAPRWVRYDTSGNENASTEDDLDAVPLFESRPTELEVIGLGATMSICRYRFNAPLPVGVYAGWFGGDPIGKTDDTGGPRFSKRLLVDMADAPTPLVWGPNGDVGGIALDREQGLAITKLLAGKGSSYAAAYYCYMKNDTNGNGKIDADEPIVWYLPAQNQLMAIWVVYNSLSLWGPHPYWSATESSSSDSWYVDHDFGRTKIDTKTFDNRVRCVRDF